MYSLGADDEKGPSSICLEIGLSFEKVTKEEKFGEVHMVKAAKCWIFQPQILLHDQLQALKFNL
jgi:hypothetical protein